MSAKPDESSLYLDVAAALSTLASDMEAAEAHGMLCGMLCDPHRFKPNDWFTQVLGTASDKNLGDFALDSPLMRMMAGTLRELSDASFSLRLILPADDEPLAARTAAIGTWCRGFLVGIGLQIGDRSLTEEGRELLQDFVQISRVNPNESASELGERDFFDVVEYVRIGALALHAEVSEHAAASSSINH